MYLKETAKSVMLGVFNSNNGVYYTCDENAVAACLNTGSYKSRTYKDRDGMAYYGVTSVRKHK